MFYRGQAFLFARRVLKGGLLSATGLERCRRQARQENHSAQNRDERAWRPHAQRGVQDRGSIELSYETKTFNYNHGIKLLAA